MADTKFAYLETHVEEVLPGHREITYKWVGDKDAELTINPCLWNLDISTLPFKLVEIGIAFDGDVYIRADAHLSWLRALPYRLAPNLRTTLRKINYRLILTAHVWGLVYFDQNGYINPSWRVAIEAKRKRDARS